MLASRGLRPRILLVGLSQSQSRDDKSSDGLK